MNSANIVLRRAVKNWDDDITRAMIGRFYDWNMQFSEDTKIKGDFKIDARGSGALLAKEKQQENLMIYANISASNPELNMLRDWEGLDKEIAKSLEVPHDKITLSEDKVKERRELASQARPDPMLEIRGGELQLKQQEAKAKFSLDQQRLAQDQQHKTDSLAQNREIELAKIASSENMTVQQLAAKVDIELKRDKTNRDTAAANIANKQTETQLKAANIGNGFDSYA